MTDPVKWQESNARQLSAALAEVRVRLERFAQASGPANAPKGSATRPPEAAPPQDVERPAPAKPAKAVTRPLIMRLLTQTADPVKMAGPQAAPSPAAAETPARPLTVEGGSSEETPSALDELAERLRLSQFERNVLTLCVAMELDTRIAGLCARAQDDPRKPYPTFAL